MTTEHREPEFLRLLFTDILGHTRSIEVGYDRLEEIIESGIVIDGSSVPGYASVNESDVLLRPSRATPLIQPWDTAAAFLPCRVHQVTGALHPGDPNSILMKTVKKASEQGLTLMVGSELEFFTVSKQVDNGFIPSDHGGYFSSLPLDAALDLRRDITRALNAVGIRTTSHHHEVAEGQQEIGLQYAPAETAADSIMLARLIISEMTFRRGLIATFMPKPFAHQNGSGMHLHQSIWDLDEKQNLFSSERSGEISTLAMHYVAGLIEHADSLIAILAPTINSYKRLVPGFEAPTRIAWGYMNRSTMVRVPHFNGSLSAARIELRCPDATSSPHLALAVMLAAGLDGIERGIEPPSPTSKDLYKSSAFTKSLPSSLQVAASILNESHIMRETLGDPVVDFIVSQRTQEWKDYAETTGDPGSSEITAWEINRYLLSN